MLRIVTLVTSLAVLSGCAVGVKHDYSSAQPRFEAANTTGLVVGAQDRRPYVLDGNKDPKFAGLSRGGFGNTFDIATQSGAPLADDFAKVIASALKARGIKAETVSLQPGMDRPTVVKNLVSTANGKAILITLNEWKTDTYMHTLLLYDATAEVLAGDGTVLARSAIKGTDNLGGGKFNMVKHSRAATPDAYRKKLEQLLNDPGIVKALR